MLYVVVFSVLLSCLLLLRFRVLLVIVSRWFASCVIEIFVVMLFGVVLLLRVCLCGVFSVVVCVVLPP